MAISPALRRLIIERDHFCCAYCQTSEDNCGQRMHVDHIYPESAGGPTVPHNLCAICISCNSYKRALRDALDPATRIKAPLFHPLQQRWADHFAWDESKAEIIGLTPCGRATVTALQMNNPLIVRARKRWVVAGWHPPTLA
ncbi:MAG: HNH endonuclease [Caldilineaceae bacterium]|jgi:hypothetical protein